MRADARISRLPGDAPRERETEGATWVVERSTDGTVRVTIDRGTFVLCHAGTAADVRTRLASDAPAADRTAIAQATRDVESATEPTGGSR